MNETCEPCHDRSLEACRGFRCLLTSLPWRFSTQIHFFPSSSDREAFKNRSLNPFPHHPANAGLGHVRPPEGPLKPLGVVVITRCCLQQHKTDFPKHYMNEQHCVLMSKFKYFKIKKMWLSCRFAHTFLVFKECLKSFPRDQSILCIAVQDEGLQWNQGCRSKSADGFEDEISCKHTSRKVSHRHLPLGLTFICFSSHAFCIKKNKIICAHIFDR